jgi:hypothetical protein
MSPELLILTGFLNYWNVWLSFEEKVGFVRWKKAFKDNCLGFMLRFAC